MGQLTSKSVESRHAVPINKLYEKCPWDARVLKRLIVEKKLAPIYRGEADEVRDGLEECPICFLWYPGGLNRVQCCNQSICTECFAQIHSTPPANSNNNGSSAFTCPFCNQQKFAVKFSGPKSAEERRAERDEEHHFRKTQERLRLEEIERSRERQQQREQERERLAAAEQRQQEAAHVDNNIVKEKHDNVGDNDNDDDDDDDDDGASSRREERRGGSKRKHGRRHRRHGRGKLESSATTAIVEGDDDDDDNSSNNKDDDSRNDGADIDDDVVSQLSDSSSSTSSATASSSSSSSDDDEQGQVAVNPHLAVEEDAMLAEAIRLSLLEQ
jgi:hypothetical protein